MKRTNLLRCWLPLTARCTVAACGLLLASSTSLAAAAPTTPVILISVDTLRADRLSCYGYRGRPTPNIDSLAREGTLFSAVSAPVPLTLPSHISLLTSSYPFWHGIEDNGAQLRRGAVTLAGVLRSQGYRTAAFVGGFVLDRRFGLDQGFDHYDSKFQLHRQSGSDPGDIKRLGEEVAADATRWIEGHAGTPFFLFLHLYDLHTPYNPPRAHRVRFKGAGYLAELSYVDHVVGQFWKFLAQRGLMDKSLIVFTSDHGEGLGDHGEDTHGYFIYQSTVWVPLIIHWPGSSRPLPARVEGPASLLDVAPTILQALGISSPQQFQGRSLISRLDGRPQDTEEVYSESLYGRNHFGVSALWGLCAGRHKYIEAPRPELYDLAADPGEVHNLYEKQRSIALGLRRRLLALRSRFPRERAPGSTPPSPEVVTQLSSLGYVAAGRAATTPFESAVNPGDRIVEFRQFGRAIALALSGRLAEANVLLEELLKRDGRLVDVRMTLGFQASACGSVPLQLRDRPFQPEYHPIVKARWVVQPILVPQ